MSGTRSQGRPIRDSAVGGKDAILHGVRDFLRENFDSDVSRKGIASFLNVTPALISYYFPDRYELLENATVPILKNITDQVDYIISSGEPSLSILRNMIAFYIECHRNEDGIIQCFSNLVVKSDHYHGPDYTFTIRAKTKDFINQKFANDSILSYKLNSMAWNIWSICRIVIVEAPAVSDLHRPGAIVGPSATDRIYTLLTDGVGLDRLPNQSEQLRAERTPLTSALRR
ncbi:TetR/AcrR family transcriptional regulator [Kaistia sp. 32K]|uniref:TetR/AcrR family transcriptional regulator n=1 Tax=Kaistia sp. 32K TaxID=2795690 RepID=UPI0019166F4C|nr:TetR/AcrR family transcriptional regulator [Kaistia sp. 32K]